MNTETILSDTQPYTKAESWKMFDKIARRYDFLNRFLSFGLDILWRYRLAKFLPNKSNLNILDLATGTGDVPMFLCKKNKDIASVTGIDLATDMLLIGREKIKKGKLEGKIRLQLGDANQLPFEGSHFDVVTIAFGIRNMSDPAVTLREMLRVLKPGGRALILEFSTPRSPILKGVYLWYLRKIVPRLGALISGDPKAYRYLNQTIEAFPYGEEFCQIIKSAGFSKVSSHLLNFGAATIYQADK